jgi:polyferredoxin
MLLTLRRVVTLVFALSVLLAGTLLQARPALAHGFEGRYELPVPLWLYLYGSAAAVLLSFVVVGLFVGKEHAPQSYPRFDLLRVGAFRRIFASRPVLDGLRLLSVALFLVVVASGLFGDQVAGNNFAPTFVWIVWWVGFSLLVAFVGNLWPLVSPWKTIFEWAEGLSRRLGITDGLELGEPCPKSLGLWPALALLFVFVWIELVFGGSDIPRNVALFAILYSVLTWSGMALFGKEVWLRNGEAFAVFFGVLARFAPTEARVTGSETCRAYGAACVDEDGECVNCYGCFERADPRARQLNLRPPAVGLTRSERVTPAGLAFIVFMLASVTYDGLSATSLWQDMQGSVAPVAGELAVGTLGLMAVPLLFLGAYAGFVKISQLLAGGDGHGVSFGGLAAAYAYSLVPIALAYQIAHYYTVLIFNGQIAIVQLSDPLGRGWDLFGTAGYQVNNAVLGAAFVWYSQVALIVAGHVIAVYLAHVISLRQIEDRRRALKSQYPMLALMVLYTITSLWIISQPIVG